MVKKANFYSNNDNSEILKIKNQKIKQVDYQLEEHKSTTNILKKQLSLVYAELEKQTELNDYYNNVMDELLSEKDSLLKRTIILTKTKQELIKEYENEINLLKNQKSELEQNNKKLKQNQHELNTLLKKHEIEIKKQNHISPSNFAPFINENNLTNKINFLRYINQLQDYNLQKLITLMKLINKEYSQLTFAIKTPSPTTDKKWGDYFFSLSLKKSLEKKGFKVVIHELEHWNNNEGDIVIVLRGLSEYTPKSHQLNLMWNISHPEDISLAEYEKYDIVFVASYKYANILDSQINTIVHPLLQCTDPSNFYPEKNNKFNNDILFVGSTRAIFRQVIKDILKTNHEFSVYGIGWEEFIDSKYIKGDFIDNTILNQAYSNCKILLNDHWEDMIKYDFISNRIFDALACKTFVISDNVDSISTLFDNAVITYTDSEDLNDKINYYLANENQRIALTNKGYDIVIKHHTFDNRVQEILSTIENKYYYYFMIQCNLKSNFTETEQNSFLELFNRFLNKDYNKIVNQNRQMNIKISRLQEKIFILEQAQEYQKEKTRNSKRNTRLKKLLKFR